ncbi:hypothetical protein P7C73_g6447, partial [Tremellales sp. Uapishka_1]
MSSPGHPLQNIYYERKTGSARPCYICRRPTQTVLSTLKTEDFVYTCDGHLTDPGFATLIPIPVPAQSPGPSSEDIRKVVSDYEARKTKATADGNKNKDEKSDKEKEKPAKPAPIPVPVASPVPALAPTPSHRKFALHRSIFDMRKAEIRRREQGVKAKEVSKGLPQVPRTAF